jgi:hypothetical protein
LKYFKEENVHFDIAFFPLEIIINTNGSYWETLKTDNKSINIGYFLLMMKKQII